MAHTILKALSASVVLGAVAMAATAQQAQSGARDAQEPTPATAAQDTRGLSPALRTNQPPIDMGDDNNAGTSTEIIVTPEGQWESYDTFVREGREGYRTAREALDEGYVYLDGVQVGNASLQYRTLYQGQDNQGPLGDVLYDDQLGTNLGINQQVTNEVRLRFGGAQRRRGARPN